MSDFEMLSLIFVVVFGTWTVHFQTAQQYKNDTMIRYDESKNGYPSRKDK